jgi:hypothetical protein
MHWQAQRALDCAQWTTQVLQLCCSMQSSCEDSHTLGRATVVSLQLVRAGFLTACMQFLVVWRVTSHAWTHKRVALCSYICGCCCYCCCCCVTCGEACASAAPETRLLHLVNNPVAAFCDEVLGAVPVAPCKCTLQFSMQ